MVYASTVPFMAEESGALGSAALAKHYKDNDIDVVGMLNLDMTGYKGGDHDITMITTHTDPAQTQFLRDLLAHYTPELTTDDSAAPDKVLEVVLAAAESLSVFSERGRIVPEATEPISV